MSGRIAMTATWVATAAGAVTMVAVVTAMLGELGEPPGLAFLFAVLGGVAIAYGTMGLLIARRRPGNRIAWVLAGGGLLIVTAFGGFGIGAFRYVMHGADDVAGGLLALVGAATLGPALFLAVAMLAILFPDGRLPGPRWRLPVSLAGASIGVSSIVTLLRPGAVEAELPANPIGIDHPLIVALGDATEPLLVIGLVAGALLATIAVAVRYRRSAGIERQQLKWLLAAVSAIGVLLPASFLDAWLDASGSFTVLDVFAMCSLALLPLCVGIAVTRYRLYEIDRIVSRTIGWAVVTALLVGVFGAAVIGLQALLAPVTANDTLAVAASTLLAAALFAPLRRRVQGAVDRRFNRERVDAERSAHAFAARLRDDLDLEAVQRGLVATAAASVEPAGAAVWLRVRG